MKMQRPVAGRPVFAGISRGLTRASKSCAVGTALAALTIVALASAFAPVLADDQFPFDQALVYDGAPMRPVKRMPSINVGADGRATVDLWCYTVPALVQTNGSAIHIETPPLPTVLPQYMSAGQCSDARKQADADLLAALTQVTEWHAQGGKLVLAGPTTLRFRASTN